MKKFYAITHLNRDGGSDTHNVWANTPDEAITTIEKYLGKINRKFICSVNERDNPLKFLCGPQLQEGFDRLMGELGHADGMTPEIIEKANAVFQALNELRQAVCPLPVPTTTAIMPPVLAPIQGQVEEAPGPVAAKAEIPTPAV